MFGIDDTELYDINTGETVTDIENLNKEELKELLEGKENE